VKGGFTSERGQHPAGVRVTHANRTKSAAAPVVIELGVPAGYSLVYEDLGQLQTAGVIRGYRVASDKITLKGDGLAAGQSLELIYRLIAQVPSSMRVARSQVYQAVLSGAGVEQGTEDVLTAK